MSTVHAYKTTPRQATEFIIDCFESPKRNVAFLQGPPGIGKSAIVHAIAKNADLELIDHRVSTSTPEDFSGLPDMHGPKAVFKPYDVFPVEGDPLPKGKNGWILFLDEFNAGKKEVQAAAYKTILDRMVGQKKLHKDVYVVAAGNRAIDRAIVNSLSTAMQSRLIHLDVELKFNDFMEDVAIKYDWDSRIIGYLSYKEDKLMDFRPDHQDKTFCCPRTWDFMNGFLKGKTFEYKKLPDGTWYYGMEQKAPLYAGTITSGVAVDFIQFTKVGQNMPTIKQIINDPKGTVVPQEPEIQWCTITHCMENTKNDDTFEKITDYINRYDANFRTLYFRSLFVRQPALRHHPVVAKAALELQKYLNG